MNIDILIIIGAFAVFVWLAYCGFSVAAVLCLWGCIWLSATAYLTSDARGYTAATRHMQTLGAVLLIIGGALALLQSSGVM